MNSAKENSWNDKPRKKSKPPYMGALLNAEIQQLPGGAPRMAALREAIAQADQHEDHRWRLFFRYDYACEAIFRDDPPKAMPVAAEFQAIYEEHPDVLGPDGREMYVMIMQMGIDPIASLPQIPMAQWEKLMDDYYKLVKRFGGLGLRTYWQQMFQFLTPVDFPRAYECFEKFWKTGRDGVSDCRACERSYAVRMSLLAGDRAAADEYGKPLKEGRISFCSDTPQKMWLAYLEDDYRRGDYREAAPIAESLYRKGNNDRTNLDYIGAVLQCWAHTDNDRAVALAAKRLEWSLRMWDQKLLYDFYKGAWVTFRELSKRTETVKLELPQGFALWREDGSYHAGELARWFHDQAEEIAGRFDKRNGSRWFADDLKAAGRMPRTMPPG